MKVKTTRSIDALPIEIIPFVGRLDEAGKPVITAPLSGCESAEVGGGVLPCLNSNISTEIASTQHRKAASALGWNVFALAQKHGLENLGFLTLTFKDHVLDVKEAQRRLNSLLTHIIKPRYQDYIGVLERQKSGRIHYHLLVVIGFDIRTGFDFAAVDAKDYSSANPALRAEWAFWRKTAPAYGFGRTELMPIKSSEEAIGKYIGKYIGKHMESRQEADKGARLVRYSRGARVASTRFQFVSAGSQQWRSKLRAFAYYVAERTGCEPTMEGIREVCGPRWAYSHREFILTMPTPVSEPDGAPSPGCQGQGPVTTVDGQADHRGQLVRRQQGATELGSDVAHESPSAASAGTFVGVPPTPRTPSLATPSGHAPEAAQRIPVRSFDNYSHSDGKLRPRRASKPIPDTSKTEFDFPPG